MEDDIDATVVAYFAKYRVIKSGTKRGSVFPLVPLLRSAADI